MAIWHDVLPVWRSDDKLQSHHHNCDSEPQRNSVDKKAPLTAVRGPVAKRRHIIGAERTRLVAHARFVPQPRIARSALGAVVRDVEQEEALHTICRTQVCINAASKLLRTNRALRKH